MSLTGRATAARDSSIGILTVLLLAGACSGGSSNAPTASSAPVPGAGNLTVMLVASGTSGVSGTAAFSDASGGQTQVEIKVEANLNLDMPTVVTPGTCSSFDESDKTQVLILNDTRDGAGTTIIPRTMAELIASPHEIHLLSAPDGMTVAACGDIR